MLADQKMLDAVEQFLRERGDIARFEKEFGPITGRMMITTREDLPYGLEVPGIENHTPVFFEATFDFYDMAIGIAMDTANLQVLSGLWNRPQTEHIEQVDQAWVDFFIKTLLKGISKEDGSYVVPIYSFVNDTSDMTIVPTG